jgi:hypothetical protein
VTPEVEFLWFSGLGVVLLLTLQAIRQRLKSNFPKLFLQLGKPSLQDSNLGKPYWDLQRFVWWRHVSEVRDPLLHCLCVVAVVIEVVVVVWFFLMILT